MINVGIALGGIIFGYGLFKGKMQAIDDRAIDHDKNDKINHLDLEKRISAQFKRIDTISLDNASMKSQLKEALTLKQAEEKFISKNELLLHMRNLELKAENTDNKIDRVEVAVEKFEGKLEDIIGILSKRTSNA